MMRHRPGTPTREAQNYFVSFTDLLVGVIFIFIIMLVTYALNSAGVLADLQRERMELATQINRLEGRLDRRSDLLNRIARQMQVKGHEVHVDLSQGVLRFAADDFFDKQRSDLKPRAQTILRALAHVLAEELPCRAGARICDDGKSILEAVYIEGHTDRQTYRVNGGDGNWPLSSDRARVTFDFLRARAPTLDQLTNSSGQRLLSISAYAATRQIEMDKADSSVNRRIDIRFLIATPTEAELDQLRQ